MAFDRFCLIVPATTTSRRRGCCDRSGSSVSGNHHPSFTVVATIAFCLIAVSTYVYSGEIKIGAPSSSKSKSSSSVMKTATTAKTKPKSSVVALDDIDDVAEIFGCYDYDDGVVVGGVRDGCLEEIAAAVDAVAEAFGCRRQNRDDDDDDDVFVLATCLEGIARDRTEKTRAQEIHRANRIEDARKRAVVANETKTTTKATTTPLLLDDESSSRSAPKPEWTIGAPMVVAAAATTTANASSSSSSAAAVSSSLPSLGLAYANIEIAGMPKAGTSHLYNLLTQRPDTMRFWHGKEYCAVKRGTTTTGSGSPARSSRTELMARPNLEELYGFHNRAYAENTKTNANSSGTLLSVNGCHYLPDVIDRYEYLWGGDGDGPSSSVGGGEREHEQEEDEVEERPRQRKQKFVVLLRDPVDWLWSAWNFWIQPGFDAKVIKHNWADAAVNYRSPELFHELLLAGPDAILDFPDHASFFRTVSGNRNGGGNDNGIRRLREVAGTDNVLVLKNEDLRPHRAYVDGGLLDVLSDFTGLNRSLFDDDLVRTYTNCNDKHGTESTCDDNDLEEDLSRYEIDGYRPMLPESRELVYLYFREECRYWSEELNVHYPDCVNVLPPEEEEEHHHPLSPPPSSSSQDEGGGEPS